MTGTKTKREPNQSGGSAQRSFRISRRTLELLDQRAHELGESRNGFAERLTSEGLHIERHPLIYFRQGGAGVRRPALAGTRLYVWQVLYTLRASDGAVPEAAEYLGLTEQQIRAAAQYCADFAEERELEQRERDRWARAQRVLG